MDRKKLKDQFKQFVRKHERGTDDDGTIRRQMKKQRQMCAAAAVLFALAAAFALTTAFYRMDAKAQSDLQRRLSEEVLRFHVLANSDSREDQALKLKVRDKVLEFLELNLADEQDMTEDETVMWIREHIDEIEDVSRMCVAEENYDYPVTAAVTTCWFPDKTYGDVTFPAGNYEALRIEIGCAKGQNWWCVLYPSLCFLDTTNAVVPNEGKEKLKHVLTEEEYSEITAGTEFKISWYFWKEK